MKTLEEVWEIVESLNEQAHSDAWDSWEAADEMTDFEEAEELREEASAEQAEYFRDGFSDLEDTDQEAILYWTKEDESFLDQFRTYYGLEEFDEEFGV